MPGLSFLIAGSSQRAILPWKISARVGPSSVNWPGLTPGTLTTGTMPPITTGNWVRPAAASSLEVERLVGGAEGHGLGLDLGDAAARTDGLIIHAVARDAFVGRRPFGDDRENETGSGAGDIGGQGESWRSCRSTRQRRSTHQHSETSFISRSFCRCTRRFAWMTAFARKPMTCDRTAMLRSHDNDFYIAHAVANTGPSINAN